MAVAKKVGTLIDQLWALKKKQEEAEKEVKKAEAKVDTVKKKYKAKEDEIFNSFDKQDIEGAFGSKAVAKINKQAMPSVKDWPKLHAYIGKTKSWDLLQRRVSTTAYRARLETGKKIPGVEKFTKVTLSLKEKK